MDLNLAESGQNIRGDISQNNFSVTSKLENGCDYYSETPESGQLSGRTLPPILSFSNMLRENEVENTNQVTFEVNSSHDGNTRITFPSSKNEN